MIRKAIRMLLLLSLFSCSHEPARTINGEVIEIFSPIELKSNDRVMFYLDEDNEVFWCTDFSYPSFAGTDMKSPLSIVLKSVTGSLREN